MSCTSALHITAIDQFCDQLIESCITAERIPIPGGHNIQKGMPVTVIDVIANARFPLKSISPEVLLLTLPFIYASLELSSYFFILH